MRKLLIKTALFLAILVLCDFTIGTALERMFRSIDSGAPGFVLNHIQAHPYDVCIMGTSGAQRGYIPAVIGKELGMSVYNTGEAGTNILYNYAALRLILQHHKPELIIWDLTNADYYYRSDAMKTGMITPYHRNRHIRQLLYSLEPLNRIWLQSRIYPYNQKTFSIVGSYLHPPTASTVGYGGYHPLEGVLDIATVQNPEKYLAEELGYFQGDRKHFAKEDKLLRQYFFAFIGLCKANNIPLLAFYCPKAPVSDPLASIPILSPELVSTLEKQHIPLHIIMPDQYPELNNPALFYDLSHLNDAGARAYSGIVARLAKGYLDSLPTGR